MNDQKRRIVPLVVMLVIVAGLSGLAARSSDQVEAAPAATTPDTDTSFLSDPNLASPSSLSLGNGELFLKMMLSVVLVGVLGVAALYVSKRVLPKVTNAPGKEIRILETAYLGPRKALHLVEVNNQKLLIGSTNESIAMLTHVEEGWSDLSNTKTDDAVSL